MATVRSTCPDVIAHSLQPIAFLLAFDLLPFNLLVVVG